jgi:predicted nucleic acid-binding protein
MIYSGSYVALLDANVLYPAPLRDYLLHLAVVELYKPKWTVQIHDEWMRNPLLKRPDLRQADLEKAKAAMDSAFPNADISGYEYLINNIILPDPQDRHILASAIKGKADVIVTANLKDFPAETLAIYGIEVQHPDIFVSNLIYLDKGKCLKALSNQVKNLRNPPKTREEVLNNLSKCGLANSVLLLQRK